jgi:hypothetical protein
MTTDDVMSQVRAMYAHLEHHAFWFPRPEQWKWSTPDGRPQTLHVPHSPGLTNLLWLAMDMGTPPGMYALQENALALLLLSWGPATYFDGVSLLDAAGIMPMDKFAARLAAEPATGNPLQAAYPVLNTLLKGRLRA